MTTRRNTRIINMSLEESLYKDVDRLARESGVSRSQVLREALQHYVAAETRWKEVLAVGEESARRSGVTSDSDVERLVHEYRGVRE